MNKKIKQSKFHKIANNIADVLLHKNYNYGDSALKPINVFIKVETDAGICIRMNDKINRIMNCTAQGKPLRKNDVFDLIGYLILYCISKSWLTFTEFID